MVIYRRKYVHLFTRNMAYVLPESVDHDVYELSLIGV